MYVYKITNKINNKIYISIATKNINFRFKQHVLSSKRGNKTNLHLAIKEFGENNFIVELLEKCNSIKELENKEKYWIKYYNSNNYNIGYNMTEGGECLANNKNRKNTTNAIIDNSIKSVDVSYFHKNNLIHPNKNMITVFKNNDYLRINIQDYEYYKKLGYFSKNYGFVTVYDTLNKINTKISIEEYELNKNRYKGINYNKTLYYNFRNKKFKILSKNKVDIAQFCNKNKIKYFIIDNLGQIVFETLSIENIPIKYGLKIFKYMLKNKKGIIISKKILDKMKNKYKNFDLIGYKILIKKFD